MDLFGCKVPVDYRYVFIAVVSLAEEETFKMAQTDILDDKEIINSQLDELSETFISIVKGYIPELSDEKVKEFVKEAYIHGARRCFRLMKWHEDLQEQYPESIEE